MADQQSPRSSAPRVEIDQSEASIVERRRALRAAEREFKASLEPEPGEGEIYFRVISKVEEHPEYSITIEVVESSYPEEPIRVDSFRAAFAQALFRSGERKARVWQARISIDEIAEAELEVIKGDPDGQFDVPFDRAIEHSEDS